MFDLTNIITSQDFLDAGTVAGKISAGDFGILVSPEYELDGVTFRILLDGHHSLAAAIEAGEEPDVTEASTRDHDAIGLPVEQVLDATWAGADYRYVTTGALVW